MMDWMEEECAMRAQYPAAPRDDTPDAMQGELIQPWRAGVLFRWGSVWIGAHYASKHKRLCVNLIPFVTIWVVAPGGDTP